MPTTLEKKVHAVISQTVGSFGCVLDGAYEKLPSTTFDDHQADLVSWGVTYGIALGIARLDDPCEPIESVMLRAQDAAWTAWIVFSHGFDCEPTVPRETDRQAVEWAPAEAVTS